MPEMSFYKKCLKENPPLRPDLNGALFVERSETKKREWKAEIVAQKRKI